MSQFERIWNTGRLTQRKYTGNGDAQREKHERNGELALLSNSRDERTASSSLPDLVQRGIHVLRRVQMRD